VESQQLVEGGGIYKCECTRTFIFIHLHMKMEPIEDSETSVVRTKTPGNYRKGNILHIEHGESLKSRKLKTILPQQTLSIQEPKTDVSSKDTLSFRCTDIQYLGRHK